jgi:hypothetical protein
VPVMPPESQPHGGKLDKLRQNTKLPEPDRDRVDALWVAYEDWLRTMDALDTRGEQRVEDLVRLLNEYKRRLDELVWDSKDDFLHRQDGQTKLRGSVLEEFLPRLVVPEIIDEAQEALFRMGSKRTLSSFAFDSVLVGPAAGEGFTLAVKNQDFAITRPVRLTADSDAAGRVERTAELAFLAAECKTNLDKTMWEGIVANARAVKQIVPGARFCVLCDWLDTPPIDTRATPIDRVFVLRGRRIPASIRKAYSNAASRAALRDEYFQLMDGSPIRTDIVNSFVNVLKDLFRPPDIEEADVLERGWF